ncbi:hypothetical protein, partial [Pseudomonas sp. Sample_11]|uniref:hypothetical protein n=1 Tax=Pseudomonas sp. Sample_11 TaxID=2448261 RepID=UPI0019D5DF76
ASNPVGDGIRSRAGSTPAVFRQLLSSSRLFGYIAFQSNNLAFIDEVPFEVALERILEIIIIVFWKKILVQMFVGPF